MARPWALLCSARSIVANLLQPRRDRGASRNRSCSGHRSALPPLFGAAISHRSCIRGQARHLSCRARLSPRCRFHVVHGGVADAHSCGDRCMAADEGAARVGDRSGCRERPDADLANVRDHGRGPGSLRPDVSDQRGTSRRAALGPQSGLVETLNRSPSPSQRSATCCRRDHGRRARRASARTHEPIAVSSNGPA